MKNKKRIIRLNFCPAYGGKAFDLDPDKAEVVVLYDLKRKPYIRVKDLSMDIGVYPGWIESYSIVEESTDTVISTFTLKTAEDCQNFAKLLSDTKIANWMLNLE